MLASSCARAISVLVKTAVRSKESMAVDGGDEQSKRLVQIFLVKTSGLNNTKLGSYSFFLTFELRKRTRYCARRRSNAYTAVPRSTQDEEDGERSKLGKWLAIRYKKYRIAEARSCSDHTGFIVGKIRDTLSRGSPPDLWVHMSVFERTNKIKDHEYDCCEEIMKARARTDRNAGILRDNSVKPKWRNI